MADARSMLESSVLSGSVTRLATLDEVGRAARGRIAGDGHRRSVTAYAGRWPGAANAIGPARLASGEAHHRRYGIAVTDRVRYDGENFRTDLRQGVAAH